MRLLSAPRSCCDAYAAQTTASSSRSVTRNSAAKLAPFVRHEVDDQRATKHKLADRPAFPLRPTIKGTDLSSLDCIMLLFQMNTYALCLSLSLSFPIVVLVTTYREFRILLLGNLSASASTARPALSGQVECIDGGAQRWTLESRNGAAADLASTTRDSTTR